VACGLAMRAMASATVRRHGVVFELARRLRSAGPVRRFLVGDPAIQVIEAIVADPRPACRAESPPIEGGHRPWEAGAAPRRVC
jgi:hypothetical protein